MMTAVYELWQAVKIDVGIAQMPQANQRRGDDAEFSPESEPLG
jgi:hypothetical protein